MWNNSKAIEWILIEFISGFKNFPELSAIYEWSIINCVPHIFILGSFFFLNSMQIQKINKKKYNQFHPIYKPSIPTVFYMTPFPIHTTFPRQSLLQRSFLEFQLLLHFTFPQSLSNSSAFLEFQTSFVPLRIHFQRVFPSSEWIFQVSSMGIVPSSLFRGKPCTLYAIRNTPIRKDRFQ